MSEQNCYANKPFKEAVCIDAMRVFDSCSSQECLEDLEFSFEECDQNIINSASYIKTKCIEVSDVNFAIDPVPFNNGFYTVDVTYTFTAEIEAHIPCQKSPVIVYGCASFSKKVILFGSSGNTQRFVSDEPCKRECAVPKSGCASCCDNSTLPTATVNIVEPMCLDTKLVGGTNGCESKQVFITIGIFAIIQLERAVPIMIPAYDYCVPGKDCSTNTDTPCELFDKIRFPIGEFFPKSLDDDAPCCPRINNYAVDEQEVQDQENEEE